MHMVWTRPLQLKLEASDVFKTFKAAAENESGMRIHEVLTDNACKLSMGKMWTCCKQEGMKLSTTIPYHPASNSMAEHTIGILMNSARMMLTDSGLPKSLWAEAFLTATYVHAKSNPYEGTHLGKWYMGVLQTLQTCVHLGCHVLLLSQQ